MAYTVWYKGQLLGATELSWQRVFPKMRMGDFEATPVGERIIAHMTECSTAIIALGKVLKRSDKKLEREEIEKMTEYADWMSAVTIRGAMELELRGADGR